MKRKTRRERLIEFFGRNLFGTAMAPVTALVAYYLFCLVTFLSDPRQLFLEYVFCCPTGKAAPVLLVWSLTAAWIEREKMAFADILFRLPLLGFVVLLSVVSWVEPVRTEARSQLWKARVILHVGPLEGLQQRAMEEMALRRSLEEVPGNIDTYDPRAPWNQLQETGPLAEDLRRLRSNSYGMGSRFLGMESQDHQFIRLSYGGGFTTGIGFVIGPPEMRLQHGSPWAPGVYFQSAEGFL